SLQDVREVSEREDHPESVQNELTHLVKIKPQRLRLITLRAVLWAINVVARYFQTEGVLGGISTIHYARWVIIDGGKRLLFMSNFDGSWESYLGDFIDRPVQFLTAIWSNTEGFPKTRFLTSEGAQNEQRFKNWTREHQILTQVWYSAYPKLSLDNVLANSQ